MRVAFWHDIASRVIPPSRRRRARLINCAAQRNHCRQHVCVREMDTTMRKHRFSVYQNLYWHSRKATASAATSSWYSEAHDCVGLYLFHLR